jgi:Putative intracellular protease/amidase
MQIAVLTFDGFNELDSFVPAAILNRMRAKGWNAYITAPTARITSMNGVTVHRQLPLEFAREADAVIVGSGLRTRDVVADETLLSMLELDPAKQLVGAQSLRHTGPGEARTDRRHPGLYRPDDQAMGPGGWRGRDRRSLLRARKRGDGGRMHGDAVSRELDHRAPRISRGRRRGDALRSSGRPKGGLRRTDAFSRPAFPRCGGARGRLGLPCASGDPTSHWRPDPSRRAARRRWKRASGLS